MTSDDGGESKTYLIAASIPVAFAAILTVWDPVPTMRAPYSLVIAAPAMVASSMLLEKLPGSLDIVVIGAAWTSAFLIWSLPATRLAPTIPRRSQLLLTATAILSFLWIASGFSWATKYQGETHAIWVAAMSALFALACAILLRWNQREPDSLLFSGFHAVMFIWIAWVAFPWLGELI